MACARPDHCDVVLVGGGLANSLVALALRRRRPELSVRMLEAEAEPDDAHTWSLFRTDVTAQAWNQLSGAFEAQWPAYGVAFPAHERTLATGYASLTGRRLAAQVADALGPGLERGRRAVRLGPQEVVCEDGEAISARVVIDGRGASPSPHLVLGFQKFVGLEVRLRRPHGLSAPLVMDARVRQEDGYRFVYVLPLAPTRLLVEDTRYSDRAQLSHGVLETAVHRYIRGRRWMADAVVRREAGVLPVVLDGDADAYFAEPDRRDLPQVGLRGLFFHPTTGYSLPDAVRVAERIAADPLASSAALAAGLQQHSRRLWRDRSFYRALNRMLFLAADPSQRYRVLERFYRLPQPVIERFYAGRSTLADKLRIVAGRPPVPIGRAIAALPASAAHA